MATETLKAGDIVKLKSGSPAFTVSSPNNTEITRIWYYSEERHSIEYKDVPTIVLQKVEGAKENGK